ncbi:hypothetical protein [Ulvibacterium sp.]|uniref:hypothetical protein n=1 Tax=Ulvibacterium sp. TaxID=2665914 RepID=UPI00261A2A6F|nr:hypothetical protein [Ulvibacterium sp.]
MELTDLLTPDVCSDLNKKKLALRHIDRASFTHSIEEKGLRLTFTYVVAKVENRPSITLILDLESIVDRNIPGSLNLHFSNSLLASLLIKPDSVGDIQFNIKGIGRETFKNKLNVKSEFNDVFGLSITKSNGISTIGINGEYKYLRIDDLRCDAFFLSGNFGEIELTRLRPLSSIHRSNYGTFEISRCKCQKCSLVNINSIKKLIIKNSEFQYLSVEDTIVDNTSVSRSSIGQLSYNGNRSVNFGLSRLNLETSGKLKIIDNTIERLSLDYLNLEAKPSNRRFLFFGHTPRKAHSTIQFEDNDLEQIHLNQINWSYYGIEAHADRPEEKKNIIIKIKQHYSTKQDVPNEKLFKSYEKIWYFKNRKRNLPLGLSYYSNLFGLSVGRPLLWILTALVVQFLLFYAFAPTECRDLYLEKWGVFVQLINPTHRTSIFTDLLEECRSDSAGYYNLVLVVDNLFRILIGYLIFQFIDAFRYKYNLGR